MPHELTLGQDAFRKWTRGFGVGQDNVRALDFRIESKTSDRGLFGETVLEGVLA